MDGDEKLLAEEEVDVLGREAVLGAREVDAVEDQIQIVAVGLDFRVVGLAHRILDRQLVEVEHVGEGCAPPRSSDCRGRPRPRHRSRASARPDPPDRPCGGSILVLVNVINRRLSPAGRPARPPAAPRGPDTANSSRSRARPFEEVDRRRIAAVLAADPELQVRPRRASLGHPHLDELPDADGVDGRERVLLDDLELLVCGRNNPSRLATTRGRSASGRSCRS